jgi:hypothetical protein
MSRTTGLIAIGLVLLGAGAVVVLLIVLRPPREVLTAGDFAKLAVGDPAAAEKRFLGKRVEVTGKVRLAYRVDGDAAPFMMVELDNDQNLDLHAVFDDLDLPDLQPGGVAVIEGLCALCEKRGERAIISLEHCGLISYTAPAK